MTNEAVAGVIASALGVPLEALRSRRNPQYQFARDVYVYCAHIFGGTPQNDLAQEAGRDRGTISDIIRGFTDRMEEDPALEAFIDRVGARLTAQAEIRRRIAAEKAVLEQLFPRGPNAIQIAFRYKISVTEAAPLAKNFHEIAAKTEWRGGQGALSKDALLSRFGTKKPTGGADLRADHPALIDGRTIFPSTVVTSRETERLLISGHNNPKLGKEVRKGPWAGFPIYHLILEERATCPRSCAMWAGCYGNAMHMARRHDHRDPDFLVLLEMELSALAGKHPFGFAVRLHTLGDFYSVEYVKFWEFMIDAIPQLHVFGFTAYGPWSEGDKDHAIGEELERLSHQRWDRFAIRFSGWSGFQGSMVVNEPPPKKSDSTAVALWNETQAAVDVTAGDKIVMCPAQTGATAACATCALCWSPSARNVTIGFLKHGMKGGKRRPRKPYNKIIIAPLQAAAASKQKTPSLAVPRTANPLDGRTDVDAVLAGVRARRAQELIEQERRIKEAIEREAARAKPNMKTLMAGKKPKGKLGISPEEQDRLIAEALAKRGLSR